MRKSVLITTLMAGTLDIVAACINAYLVSGVTPAQVLSYIASGLFGKTAYSGGPEILLAGLVFHYLIAFACTTCFYWIYPLESLTQKLNLKCISDMCGGVAGNYTNCCAL